MLVNRALLWEVAIKVNLGRLSVGFEALEHRVIGEHFLEGLRQKLSLVPVIWIWRSIDSVCG